MRILTQADVLALWEAGRSLHPLDQGVLAVQAAFPEVRESVADWPLGRRNRALAELRVATFGAGLRGWMACRQCAEQLEFEMDGRALAKGEVPAQGTQIDVYGRSYRLPTSSDLAAVATENDSTAAARRLLSRCCTNGEGMTSNETVWSDEEMEAIGERMAAADPLAEILLSFECPNCAASFVESLDLPAFLWAEMEGRAKRLLLEVHALASAYGWSEREILALPPVRREFYLGQVRA
jgi:hypothetical protein